MAGEGQMLQAAREEKQWSFTYTEEITKIRVRYIHALEEEKYEILPGTTYVKGYLRTYAKHLGLNSDEIIALYNSSATPEPIPVLKTPNIPITVRPHWVRPLIIGSMAVVAIVLVITIAALSRSGNKLVDSPYAPAALPSAPQTVEITPPPSSSVPIVPNSANLAATTQEGLTMQLVFIQPCWIEVRVDGQPSFQGTFTTGTSKEVKGTNKIELVSVGNAGGLSVTLNGKALPSLGKAGEVLHNIILTKDSLNQP
ncbi:MAG: XRE family transcriptional regulator [Desulfosporosinus sp. BRH_c37]|nr:MAG: XRE family transcriptional regulator [Desulfosporosinus sp. BRH_c37]